MESKPQKLIVILSESVTASLVKDAGTFLLFGGLMYFNHRVLSGNGWLDFLFILIVILWLSSRNLSTVYRGDKTGAVKWLEDK